MKVLVEGRDERGVSGGSVGWDGMVVDGKEVLSGGSRARVR